MGLVAFCHVKAVVVSLVLLSYVKLWQLWFGAVCFVPFCYGSLGEVCQVVGVGYGSYGDASWREFWSVVLRQSGLVMSCSVWVRQLR